MRRYLYGWLVAGVAVSAVPFLFLFGADSQEVAYLKTKPLSPWSIMALSASGEEVALDSLKAVSGEKAIDLEAPILALTAAGKDPRVFGSEDLVARLKSFYDGTQLGEAEIVNDDIFGLLALIASGEKTDDTVVIGIKNFILSKQNADGGFSFAAGGASDTNTTAATIMALRAAGVMADNEALARAADYLKAAQNDDGGFPYDPKGAWGTASDASSDAWVIMAARALGTDAAAWQKSGNTPLSHLETLKQEGLPAATGAAQAGGFYLYQAGGQEDSFTPVTTSYALLALSGKTLPVRIITPESPPQTDGKVSFSFRIEGKDAALCSGDGRGIYAIEAVYAAKEQCETEYHVTTSALGEYVDEIGGEKASGLFGWLYAVNGEVPSVGAGAKRLAEGDSVLWYFGAFGDTPKHTAVPLSVTIPPAPAGAGGGGSGDGNGNDGAENPLEGSAVSLTVELGKSGGASPLGFGTLTRGSVSQKAVALKNSGQVAVTLSTSVSGHAVFRRYLRLGERDWRSFRAALPASAATTAAVSLAIPVDYSESGEKQGVLVFWATPAAQ